MTWDTLDKGEGIVDDISIDKYIDEVDQNEVRERTYLDKGEGIVDEETVLPSVQYIYLVADISDKYPAIR